MFSKVFWSDKFGFWWGICILSEGQNTMSLAKIVFTEVGYFCILWLAYLKTHIPGEQLAPKYTPFFFVDKALLLQGPPLILFQYASQELILKRLMESPFQVTSCELILFLCQLNWQLSWIEDKCGTNDMVEDWKYVKECNDWILPK